MDEITAKRLAVIRHLYEQGVALSMSGEPTNGLSLLPFHDSVEMFMKLCADTKNIVVDHRTNFLDYFDKIPDLKCKAQMANLNKRRVSLKHHGQLPSSLDVDISRTNVAEFFKENTQTFFGCDLEDLSLEVLISYESVKEYLSKYHDFMSRHEYLDAQAQCQIAFKELLIQYTLEHGRSLDDGASIEIHHLQKTHIDSSIDNALEYIEEDMRNLNEAIKIMNLGINYFQYSEFVALGPEVYRWPQKTEYDYYRFRSQKYKKETAEACYKFVVNSTLQLQNKNDHIY